MKKLFIGIFTLCAATISLGQINASAQQEAQEAAQHTKNALKTSTQEAKNTAYSTAESLKDRAGNMNEYLKDKTETTGEHLKDKTMNTAEYIKDKAVNAGEYVKDKAENAAEATGNVFQRFGNWFNASIWAPIKNMFSAKKTETNQAKEVTVKYNPNK